MRISQERIRIDAIDEGAKPTLVSMEAHVFADERAIAVFKLHPDNEGAKDIAHVRKDIIDGLTQTFKIEPRDLRYFEDRGVAGNQYAERTFDRTSDGQVVETKPIGGSSEIGISKPGLDDLIKGYAKREEKLLTGQDWAKDLSFRNDNGPEH